MTSLTDVVNGEYLAMVHANTLVEALVLIANGVVEAFQLESSKLCCYSYTQENFVVFPTGDLDFLLLCKNILESFQLEIRNFASMQEAFVVSAI